VHTNRSARRAKVIPDGKNLLSHAGVALLAELADRSGLTDAMSSSMADCGISWHTHDPGVVLTHLAVAIADGADCLADIAALKPQEELFGPVASVATAWRAVHATTSVELRGIPQALAAARERIWAKSPPVGPMTWDTDDHLELLEQAYLAVPPEYRAGHDEGDDPSLVVHPILVRADSAGASHRFVDALEDANFEYSLGFPVTGSVRDALVLAQEEDWARAIETGGRIRDGAEVIELTDLMSLQKWPTSMRVICRRERPHPGAQLSLFDTHEGLRHTCFVTNTKGGDIASLELRHRGHARVEDRVRCQKACGFSNLPFEGFCANQAWVAVSLVAASLLAWSQMMCFSGVLAKAEPKTFRYRILHVAAVLVHRQRDLVLRLDETWPWASELASAFTRLRAAFP
jgi:hypothetical protein